MTKTKNRVDIEKRLYLSRDLSTANHILRCINPGSLIDLLHDNPTRTDQKLL
jgi:hypothetical protein